MITCNNNQVYRPGQAVSSLVDRPPTIQVGTVGKILNRWIGTLYAVKMPNGDLYRWLDNQDLYAVDPSRHNVRIGDLAIVELSDYSHFYHPQLENGVVVKIVKIIRTDYYQVDFGGESYGWFTGFELTTIF